MNHLQLGGCCLSPHGAASAFSTKEQEIMARFRPIAPKPLAYQVTNPLPSDSILLPSPSESRFPLHHRPSTTRRCRKRRGSACNLVPARVPKRAAATNASANADTLQNWPCDSCHLSSRGQLLVSGALNSGGNTLDQSKRMLEKGIMYTSAVSTPAFQERQIDCGTLPKSLQVSTMALQEKDIAVFPERQIDGRTTVKALEASTIPCQEEGDVKLVTLHLLSDMPSRVDSSDESSPSLCTSAATLRSRKACDDMAVVSANNFYSFPLLDKSYIQNMFGALADPFILVDSSHQLLWFNKAYEKSAKAMPPFVNAMGFPTHFGTFRIPSSTHIGSSLATLWCFMKKIVKVDTKIAIVEQNSQPMSVMEAPFKAEGQGNIVITPQPKRLVGSTVCLESVTQVQLKAAGSLENVEDIERELEEGTTPAFMADASNRVRWVNTAYKKMVGQPECPWLAITAINNRRNGKTEKGMTTLSSPSSPRLAGEVLLVGASEKIPELAGAFSGRVNIQWSNKGERSSMTVPCDVIRVCLKLGRSLFVWKFDVRADLRL